MPQTCAGQGMIFEELCYCTDFVSLHCDSRILIWCLILSIFLKETEFHHNSRTFIFVCCLILPYFSVFIMIWWPSWYYCYIFFISACENLPPLSRPPTPLPVEIKLSVIIIGPEGSSKGFWVMGRPDRVGKGEIIHWDLNLPVITSNRVDDPTEA